jgi:hypothetical protein
MEQARPVLSASGDVLKRIVVTYLRVGVESRGIGRAQIQY